MVRWRPRRLDHLHALFPGTLARWLRLRPPDCEIFKTSQTSCPPHHSGHRWPRDASHRPLRFLEAARHRKPNSLHPPPSDCRPWPPVFRALHNRPIDSALVSAFKPRPFPVSPLCALQRRLLARADFVPLLLRNPFHSTYAVHALVRWPHPLRSHASPVSEKTLDLFSLASVLQYAIRNTQYAAYQLSTIHYQLSSLARPPRLRLHQPPRHHEQNLPGRRRHSIPLDSAARSLPAQLH